MESSGPEGQALAAANALSLSGRCTMRMINIAPLLTRHRSEMLADLRRLSGDGGVTDVAFMLPMAPEGEVPTPAKAVHLSDCFREMKEGLRGSGLRVGVLLQSTIGHGPRSDAGFQRIVNSQGRDTACMCPLGRGFRKYIGDAVATLARARPDFFLVDDDFRLLHFRHGCFCAAHVAALNRLSAADYDRPRLLEALDGEEPESRRLGEQWHDVLADSLVELARVIRRSIDSVDPAVPCGYCACSADIEFAAPVARALAGQSAPFVRVNNARYLETGNKDFPARMHHTAFQVHALQGIDEILSETDSCPHNRYSVSARSMHAHIAGSLLNGCTGVKLWITRLDDYEPASGVAYRDMLVSHRGFYRELAGLLPAVEWQDPITPLPVAPVRNWNPIVWEKREKHTTWTGAVCGRLGIPSGSACGRTHGVAMLSGDDVDLFSDGELAAFLAGGLLLDGMAGVKLCRRGFSEHLGVTVDAPSWTVSLERFESNAMNGIAAGREIRLAGEVCRILPRGTAVSALTTMYRQPWYMSPDVAAMGPGLTLFENHAGGRVAIYAASLAAGGFESFVFLNESRKTQLINVLGWLNRAPLPVVALGDVDLYTRYGTVSPRCGGGELFCVLNLNPDALPELGLCLSDRRVREVLLLSATGEWRKTDWRYGSASTAVVRVPVETMEPLVLRLRRQ